ncbi:MAG: HDIG domain-containing metalloprotein [Polyangiaceae bacterium]
MLRTRVRAGALTGFVLSAVFAILLTLVQMGDQMIPQLAPHFGAPTPITIRVPYASFIEKGQTASIGYEHTRVMVPRGTMLDENDDADRVAYAFETTLREPSRGRVLATFIVFLTLFLLCATYLRRFGPSRTRLLRTQLGLFAVMAIFVAIAKIMLIFTPVSEFWIPLAAVPLWCTFALERRTAFLINVMLAFMTASLLMFDLPLLTVLITRGIAASLLFIHRKHPREMVLAGAAAGVVAAVVYTAVLTVFEGRFDPSRDLDLGMASPLGGCVGGGILAGIIAQAFRQMAERALGSVSRDRLIELTDLEQPLLQKMAKEAPGSWEHARAMANLAEAASSAIGADALLTRVGAYYHDLGKTIQPKYFVENLLPGERSPHDELDPDVSADAIMAHVVQGAKILREGRVPEPVVEFAYTHHGTQVIEYFWHKAKERGNPKKLAEDFFRYPGMKPQTKETAILMLVDSIEAASRTIQPPERVKFEEMIQRVIFTKLKSGQLDESGLTLEDMRILVIKMTDTLVNMFHGRIKYPWQEKTAQEKAAHEKAQQTAEKAALSKHPEKLEKPSEKPKAEPEASKVEEKKTDPQSKPN